MAEKGLNTYQALAENDYLFIKASISVCKQIGNYNNVAILCQQVCEKYLKATIVEVLQDDEEAKTYLGTHNLKALLAQINKVNKLINVSYRDIKYVSDFYFDAKYPGDSFTVVNFEMFEECLEITESVREQVIDILSHHQEQLNKSVFANMKLEQSELFE